MFGLASLLALAFCFCYFLIDKDDTFLRFSALNFALGMTLGLSLLLIGIGAIQWAKKLMGDHEIFELRHPASSSEEDRAQAMTEINKGIDESGFGRRPLIRNSKPSDLEIGQLVNAEPAILFETDSNGEKVLEGTAALQAKSKAAVIVVRMRPQDITPPKGRENWGIDGILCFSKICTHVGCPISLWEQQTHHLLCPCHQSTFDLADGGKVIFGPAHRPLPQLPLAIDSEGYIVAVSDFQQIVAPSYPELARDQKKLDKKS
jgi:ubiquinol-cytochrome c reductase iron-sulfur subunit